MLPTLLPTDGDEEPSYARARTDMSRQMSGKSLTEMRDRETTKEYSRTVHRSIAQADSDYAEQQLAELESRNMARSNV